MSMRRSGRNTTALASHPCGSLCEPILRALPKWFGIEESLVQYVKDADTMPTWLAKEGDHVIGFLTLRMHFPQSAEIHCMAVHPDHHRKGIGTRLVHALERDLACQDVRILQVKTIAEQKECAAYAMTRRFYGAIGFMPLEVFPTLWDESNPCLLLVKALVDGDEHRDSDIG